MKVIPVTSDEVLFDRIVSEVPHPSAVIDVGAGMARYHSMILPNVSRLTLVDAFMPYLVERKEKLDSPKVQLINGEVEKVLPIIRDRAYDVALAIDFIEHLSKEDAINTIREMRRVACRVVIFTPQGLHPQDHDYYEMGGDYWQTHRSDWQPEELEGLGFDVEEWTGFHAWAIDRYGAGNFSPNAIYATWNRRE
jgi:hypothetical protein